MLGLCAGMFAGDRLPLMLACYPLLLMVAVVLGESRQADAPLGRSMSGTLLTADEWVALQRAVLLAGPLLAAIALLLICRPRPREAVAAMVAFLWQLPALLLLQLLAAQFHWWNFAGEDDMIVGLPIDVWIGWAIWWGPVVVFANRWLTLPLLVVLSVLIDLATMPSLTPLVELGPQWIVGDAVAVTLCLAPGLWIAR